MRKLSVIGAGHVGLVTAACFADLGYQVLCVKKTAKNLDKLNQGIPHIYEPGLSSMLKDNVEDNRLKFSTDIKGAVEFSDVIFICVGTPQSKNGKADLSQVEAVARQIAQNIDGYKLVIEKSTVPVNTYQWVRKTIKRYSSNNYKFDVASNPEFLREGKAVRDFMNPDRIVVGVESDRARRIFEELYSPFTENGCTLLIVKPSSAEMIKHVSNSFLAMKISFINKVAELCEKVDTDVVKVAEAVGYDHRIGRDFLDAGIGYGGSCFSKDVKAFIDIAESHGVDFTLLKETENINNECRERFFEKILNVLWINKNSNISVWGLSFKPGTDDIRQAPSLEIVRKLYEMEANLRLYDPQAEGNFRRLFQEEENIKFFQDKYDTLRDADALLILTEWDEFKKADLNKVKELMRLPIIIDGRNIYDPDKMKEFEYYSMGRRDFDRNIYDPDKMKEFEYYSIGRQDFDRQEIIQ